MKTQTKIAKLILCLFLSISAIAQDSIKKVNTLNRAYFTIEYFQQYCFRTIDYEGYYGNHQYGVMVPQHWEGSDVWSTNYYYNPKNDKPEWSYGVGAGIKILLYKGLSLQIGLQFQKLKYKTGIIDTVYQVDDYSGVKTVTKWANKYSYNYEYSMISIPMTSQYNFRADKKLFYTVGLGYTATIMQEVKVTGTGPGGKVNSFGELHHNAFPIIYGQSNYFFENMFKGGFVHFNLGINYKFYKQKFVSIEPQFKINLRSHGSYSYDTSSNHSSRLYSYGIAIKVNI